MKRSFLCLLAMIFMLNVQAQKAVKKITLTLNETVGTNAASVAYNPDKKLYYTAFAGNSTYYLEVHDETGQSIYSTEIGADIRGMWYNESKKRLEGILYANEGSFSFELTAEGYPTQIKFDDVSYGMDSQSVPAYFGGKLYFADVNGITVFNVGNGTAISTLSPTCLNGVSYLNFNSLVFNGSKFGICNSQNNSIFVFNQKGKKKKEIRFSTVDGASVMDYFNASFANGLVFLFNQETRQWIGYQVF